MTLRDDMGLMYLCILLATELGKRVSPAVHCVTARQGKVRILLSIQHFVCLKREIFGKSTQMRIQA